MGKIKQKPCLNKVLFMNVHTSARWRDERGIFRAREDRAPSAEAGGMADFTQISPLGRVINKIQNGRDFFKNMWKLFMDYADGPGINV